VEVGWKVEEFENSSTPADGGSRVAQCSRAVVTAEQGTKRRAASTSGSGLRLNHGG
jgi:hypothetical protein